MYELADHGLPHWRAPAYSAVDLRLRGSTIIWKWKQSRPQLSALVGSLDGDLSRVAFEGGLRLRTATADVCN